MAMGDTFKVGDKVTYWRDDTPPSENEAKWLVGVHTITDVVRPSVSTIAVFNTFDVVYQFTRDDGEIGMDDAEHLTKVA